jgi:hypothetical protein
MYTFDTDNIRFTGIEKILTRLAETIAEINKPLIANQESLAIAMQPLADTIAKLQETTAKMREAHQAMFAKFAKEISSICSDLTNHETYKNYGIVSEPKATNVGTLVNDNQTNAPPNQFVVNIHNTVNNYFGEEKKPPVSTLQEVKNVWKTELIKDSYKLFKSFLIALIIMLLFIKVS